MRNSLLNKKNTTILHGVAVLMMVYHHLFISGNTWYNTEPKSLLDIFNNINIGSSYGQLTLSWFCKICVAIFAFTSGYAMFIQFSNKVKHDLDIKGMYLYVLKRFLAFYKKFFIMFMIFITIEYLNGNQNGFNFEPLNYFLNLLGFTCSFNSTWWYVCIYYYMILISPIVYIILKKINLKAYIIIGSLFVLSIVIAFVTGNGIIYLKGISHFIQNYVIIYLLIFMEGMFSARYNLIDIIGDKLNLFTALLMLIITYILRALLIRAPSDCLFDLVFTLPLIISIAKLMTYSKYLSKALEFIGKYSTYIWFTHSYFYSYIFFRLVLRADQSIFVYIQVVAYSLLTSFVLTYIEKGITKLLSKKHD